MKLALKLPSFKASPVVRISVGLLSLIIGWMVLLDMLVGFWPDTQKSTLELREKTSENIGIQASLLIQAKDAARLQDFLNKSVKGNEQILSVGIRHNSGQLVMQSGDHNRFWKPPGNDSSMDFMQLTITAGGQSWGKLEVAFVPIASGTLKGWLMQPTVISMSLLTLGGLVLFVFYLRNVFKFMNPADVVPDRVKTAFDAFSAGVMMVDATGNIMIANKVFRAWGNDQNTELFGKPAQEISWIASVLGADPLAYPWNKAMHAMQSVNGWPLKIVPLEGKPIKALVNCSVIHDATGSIRGCLVTFDDVTELEEKNENLRKTMGQLEKSQEEIKQKNEELYRLATRDPMTGAYNRRAFYAEAEKIFEEYKASKKPLCALMTDIDHFKKFNDVHGHAIGDKVIVAFSKSLGVGLRTEDKLCRYGGEEFVILLPGAEAKVAYNIAERLRVEVEQRAGPSIRHTVPLNITSSFGVGVLEDDVVDLAMLVDRADQGLYVAKKSGRNRVKFYGEPIEENAPPEAPRDLF